LPLEPAGDYHVGNDTAAGNRHTGNQAQRSEPFPYGVTGGSGVNANAERLWFCAWLPNLPLEAVREGDGPTAVVEEQQGVHRILLADTQALTAGVIPGQAANAALALLPTLQLEERSPVREQQALENLAGWFERFSSFVSIAGDDVLLLEIAGSLRLFGGLQALRQKMSSGLRELGFTAAPALAPTPLAATWLARSGRRVCIRDATNLPQAVRRLPLACLDWPSALCEALTGMGATTVGDCLRLPREGFTRRFGAHCLLELDRALGLLPDPRQSWRAPERFQADYEMTEEQTDRELLLNICRELLQAHERFLLVRQLGTQRLSFSFFHFQGPATELRLGCALAERAADRWFELLGIRFERLALPAPVIAVRLRSGLTQPLQAASGRLRLQGKPGSSRRRFSITQLAERLIARIGDQSVQAATMVAEHRPHYAWRAESFVGARLAPRGHVAGDPEQPAGCRAALPARRAPTARRPLWMLPEPVRLSDGGGYPVHQGRRLQLVDGPERLETGWWDEDGISRDYYTAQEADGRQLWVFRNRSRELAWYLHGYFG
jgi:protein ImuB